MTQVDKTALAATPVFGGEAAAELVQRFETESMALHKTQREWLVREISKALAAPPASPLRVTGARDLVEEAACLIWAELCPGMVMGDDDLPHYEAAAKDVLALSSASPLRGKRPTNEQLEEWVQYLDWDAGLNTAQEIRQLGTLLARILPILASPPEQPAADLHWLVDWVHLYATEGQSWISTTSADRLIALAARRPTRGDAERLKTEMLSAFSPAAPRKENIGS